MGFVYFSVLFCIYQMGLIYLKLVSCGVYMLQLRWEIRTLQWHYLTFFTTIDHLMHILLYNHIQIYYFRLLMLLVRWYHAAERNSDHRISIFTHSLNLNWLLMLKYRQILDSFNEDREKMQLLFHICRIFHSMTLIITTFWSFPRWVLTFWSLTQAKCIILIQFFFLSQQYFPFAFINVEFLCESREKAIKPFRASYFLRISYIK